MGLEEILYLRFANAILEPIWNRNYVECVADHDGRELRRRGPRALLRPGRRAARRRRQPPDAGRRGRRDGGARRGGDADDASRTRRSRCSARSTTADPAHYVRGQYDGYRDIDGVAPDSTTETYAALRLDIENWRWSGVPFFIRTGKRLPVTQTELRLVFKRPPRLGFGVAGGAPEPNQLVVKLDPSTGVRLIVDAHRADASRAGADHARHGVRRARAARAPTPYEVLLHAALDRRQHALHPAGRGRGDLADHAAAARRAAARAPVRARGRGARRRPSGSSAGYGRWHGPWIES